MPRHILNEEWDNLSRELQQLVPDVIAMVLHSGQREGLQYGQRGEIYGFVHPGGGICWGVDNPGNIARGVISGLELNKEMLRFPAGIVALQAASANGVRLDRDDQRDDQS